MLIFGGVYFLFAFGFLDGGLEPSNQLKLLFWYLKVSLMGSYSYRAERLYGIMPCHAQDISVNDPLFRLSRNARMTQKPSITREEFHP